MAAISALWRARTRTSSCAVFGTAPERGRLCRYQHNGFLSANVLILTQRRRHAARDRASSPGSGLAVATARAARGLTQQELADSLSIDRTYLARLESGLSTVLLERSLRLLRRLGAEIIVQIPDTAGDPN
ncbi:MAG: helix-turn-helix transcriptional regulator [Kineosporiaceae bacterium]|nr:helix-turn-helix transcriptional regulator [Kineosporiaceae bacterium]